jgi:hypothetical protein
MTRLAAGRGHQVAEVTADEVVVFLVGMRVNRWRQVRHWWPVFVAMPRLLAELQRHPEQGLLGARTFWSGRVFMVVQYWRGVEELGRYARAAEMKHAPAWQRFYRSGASGSGAVGVFHETYAVPRESIESRYVAMPPLGLGAAVGTAPRAGHRRASRAERRVVGAEGPDRSL